MPGRVHLVGIAGSGMQSLARLLGQRGTQVTGSDRAPLMPDWLADAGIRTAAQHSVPALPADAELVVFSQAIPPDWPELLQARERGIATVSYAQALGLAMRGRQGIVVAGTHGKSTTVAMVAHILEHAQLRPSVVAGASTLDGLPLGRAGEGDWFVAEGCEFRRSFLQLSPRVAAVLNVEPDHFDCFPQADDLDAAFREFVGGLPSDGLLLVNADCARARLLSQFTAAEVEWFGKHSRADWSAANVKLVDGRARFELRRHRARWGEVALPVAGLHQVGNALAAIGLAHRAGAPREAILAGLATFEGLKRRLETLGTCEGVAVIDDYAHHPTEVQAAIAAVRAMHPDRRLLCVFQPHQASRTVALIDEFARELTAADSVAVADVFCARELPAAGHGLAEKLAAKTIACGGDVLQVHSLNDILKHVHAAVRPGDVVLTLGAGDIERVAHGLIDGLRRTHGAAK